ncbi:MAG: glycogen-binding domain-containing protein [Treponema sp.]|nr:glycogen-binding domain-containing protein [Candidatus Treponema merdequi]
MKNFVKKILILTVLADCFLIFAKGQEKKSAPEVIYKYPYEYRVIANTIREVGNPFQVDDYIVFTQEDTVRHVGIAFNFEGYKEIHSFMRKNSTDVDGNVTGSLLFYILDVPADTESIDYRIIVDGIWTTDTTNVNSYYNPYTGIEVSTLNIKNNHKNETKKTDSGVHFIYQGKEGQKIRIGGTFTSWDSSIYELTETKPGYYEITIPLPQGTYYYAFYNGTASFPDKTNPDRAWSNEGRECSILTIN